MVARARPWGQGWSACATLRGACVSELTALLKAAWSDAKTPAINSSADCVSLSSAAWIYFDLKAVWRRNHRFHCRFSFSAGERRRIDFERDVYREKNGINAAALAD